MTISERIQAEIIPAMKAKDEHKLTTLRMVKSALKNKEIEKREALTDAEESQILTTLIKQRKESVESFTKGGRPELAEKEQLEIAMIEAFLPQAATARRRSVRWSRARWRSSQRAAPSRDRRIWEPAMKVVQQRLLASGTRADGKLVSEILKAELAK